MSPFVSSLLFTPLFQSMYGIFLLIVAKRAQVKRQEIALGLWKRVFRVFEGLTSAGCMVCFSYGIINSHCVGSLSSNKESLQSNHVFKSVPSAIQIFGI
uniref:Putative secreted protein n=1 Tax=Ixodes ricinus TaxID=34613 RepID=A0A6B0UFL9_IXORI